MANEKQSNIGSFRCKKCHQKFPSKKNSVRTAIHGGRICAQCNEEFQERKEKFAVSWLRNIYGLFKDANKG